MNDNMDKLGEEKDEHMTPGFEILFPSLIELAQKLEIKVSNQSPVMKEIYARRDLKLAKLVHSFGHSINPKLH